MAHKRILFDYEGTNQRRASYFLKEMTPKFKEWWRLFVLVIGTDRERYQASTTFIFQLVGEKTKFRLLYKRKKKLLPFSALSFSISEVYLHYTEFLGETCAEIKLKKMFISCQTLIIQICFASVVCASSTCFTIIYIYVSLIDLKKTYGTFNISNVLNFNC